jgi:hypothetical protein
MDLFSDRSWRWSWRESFVLTSSTGIVSRVQQTLDAQRDLDFSQIIFLRAGYKYSIGFDKIFPSLAFLPTDVPYSPSGRSVT